jgi:hypothetical protein
MISSVTAAPSQAVDQFFKKVDANRNGKLTKEELTTALESATGQSESAVQTNVDEFFKLLDTANRGYVTEQDVASGLQEAADSGAKAEGAGGPGGPPPAGGGGGGASEAATVTAPADSNAEGNVSMEEQTAYLLKQYSDSGSDSAQPSRTEVFA